MSVPESSFIASRIRDALAAIHQRTLELIVHGASLEAVLDALCDGIDALDPDMISSVFLADRERWADQRRQLSDALVSKRVQLGCDDQLAGFGFANLRRLGAASRGPEYPVTWPNRRCSSQSLRASAIS